MTLTIFLGLLTWNRPLERRSTFLLLLLYTTTRLTAYLIGGALAANFLPPETPSLLDQGCSSLAHLAAEGDGGVEEVVDVAYHDGREVDNVDDVL